MRIKFVRLKYFYAAILSVIFILSGCCPILRQHDNVPYRVVTQVHILYQNGDVKTERDFFQEENIQHILEYLRYIDPYGIPREDPEQAEGRNFIISVIYSDDSKHIYEQRADRYFRIDGGKWKRIDSQKALILSGLYAMMPSDQPETTEPIPPLLRPQI